MAAHIEIGVVTARRGADINRSMIGVIRKQWLALVFAGFGVWTMVYLGLYGFAWTDYDFEVTPAYDALVAGHVWRFLQLAPAYGGSLEMRAPFALLPSLWGGGEQAVYQAVGIPCLIAGALLGVWLYARLRDAGASRLARWTALGLCAANPITMYACEIGHPEELLGGVLCVVAVLAAQRGRWVWAALALGLAIANKEWALLAVGPVLLALPAHRWRALVTAGATAAVFYLPLLIAQLGSHGAFTSLSASSTGGIFQPWQIWWFLGATGHVVRDSSGLVLIGYRVPPSWLSSFVHPLIVLLGLPLTLLAGYRARRVGGADALLLLAALLLLRCDLDPWDNVYYLLPFIISLVAWEAVRRSRPPFWGLLATLMTWVVFEALPTNTSADMRSTVFLAASLPALAALALALWRPGQSSPLATRVHAIVSAPRTAAQIGE
jgi:hypothetical protein